MCVVSATQSVVLSGSPERLTQWQRLHRRQLRMSRGVMDPSAWLPAVTSDSARPRWSFVSFFLNQLRLLCVTCLFLHQRTTCSSVTFINFLLNSVAFTSKMPFPSFLVSQFPCYFRFCLSLSLSVSSSSSVILQKEERL